MLSPDYVFHDFDRSSCTGNREFKFDFEYRYQQQVMFMHCGRKKHEGKRRHVAKHLKLGGVGGLYLKFELQLKSNKIFIRFPDSPFPVLKIAKSFGVKHTFYWF